MLDPDAHIADMDKRGIDVEIVSSCTVMAHCEWADPRTDLALNQRLNDANAQAQQAHSGRVLGSITLPLQAPDLALRELVRAADELGLRVVNMPANVRGTYVGHPSRAFPDALGGRRVETSVQRGRGRRIARSPSSSGQWRWRQGRSGGTDPSGETVTVGDGIVRGSACSRGGPGRRCRRR